METMNQENQPYEALNKIAAIVHDNARAKGFWDDPETLIQTVARTATNIHGEVSELWEAARRGQLTALCDKGIDLTCAEEEIADGIIRYLDLARVLGIDAGRAVQLKHQYNTTRPHRHGGKLA